MLLSVLLALVSNLQRDGFVVVPNVIEPELVEELRRLVLQPFRVLAPRPHLRRALPVKRHHVRQRAVLAAATTRCATGARRATEGATAEAKADFFGRPLRLRRACHAHVPGSVGHGGEATRRDGVY